MNYEEVLSSLESLDFLTGRNVNFGKRFDFGLNGIFYIDVLKTFAIEGYAICYCISHYGGEFSFEEFYERMPQKMQENIIFNIDVFHKINAGQCSEEHRQDIISWAEIISEEYHLESENEF